MSAVVHSDAPNPSRLRLARKRRGLNKVELSRRAGISVKSLGDFEKGRAKPSPSAVDSLAAVLRFPVAFFHRPELEEPSPDGVSFRSLSTMSAGKRDAALAAVALAFELCHWVESQFDLVSPDLPSLHEYPPADAAMVLRNYWGYGVKPMGNMIAVLESHGIRVFSLSERGKEVDAFSLWYKGAPFVFLNTMKTVEHGRMDAAHELAHLVLHRHGAISGRDVEKDARVFASAFLMPGESLTANVGKLVGPSFATLAATKRHWGVSMAALALRLNQLGLLTDYNYRGVCIELSKFGRTREPHGIAERETSVVLAKVFAMLKESGTTKADVAKQLDLYVEDLDALIFGISPLPVSAGVGGGKPTTSQDAEARRRRFRVV